MIGPWVETAEPHMYALWPYDTDLPKVIYSDIWIDLPAASAATAAAHASTRHSHAQLRHGNRGPLAHG